MQKCSEFDTVIILVHCVDMLVAAAVDHTEALDDNSCECSVNSHDNTSSLCRTCQKASKNSS